MSSTEKPAKYSYRWYIDRFNDVRENAPDFLHSIEEDLFFLRPNERAWSVGECYGHLNEFGDHYMRSIRNGLEKAPGNRAEPGQSFKPGLITRGVIYFFNPPYRIKIKTLKPFKPETTADLNKNEVIDRFAALQDTLIQTLEQCREQGIDLAENQTSHPLFRWIRMTLTECFSIVEVHQRRHIWQADQVLELIG